MLHQFEEDVTEAGPHRPYESPTTVHKLRLPHLQVDVQLRFFFFLWRGGYFCKSSQLPPPEITGWNYKD